MKVRKIRVAILEDNEACSSGVKRICNNLGYETFQEYTPKESFALLQRLYFDLAVVDLNIEGANEERFDDNPLANDYENTGGVDVLKLLKRQGFGTKSIIVTANPDTQLAFRLGDRFEVLGYIKKQIDPMSGLKEALREFSPEDGRIFPQVHSKAFSSHKGGVDHEVWYSGCLQALSPRDGANGLEALFKHVNAIIYPFYPEKSCPYLKKDGVDLMRLSVWSLELGCPLELQVGGGASALTADGLVFDGEFSGVKVVISKTENSREEFESHE